jgi:hypothetical protein
VSCESEHDVERRLSTLPSAGSSTVNPAKSALCAKLLEDKAQRDLDGNRIDKGDDK